MYLLDQKLTYLSKQGQSEGVMVKTFMKLSLMGQEQHVMLDNCLQTLVFSDHFVIHVQTIKCLLSLGSDVNVRDKNERTALQLAVAVNRPKVARCLIDAGG